MLTASPEERRSRLAALAEEILRQEVIAGNTFACPFALWLHEHGRGPEATLAGAVGTALLRARNGRGPSRVARGSLTGHEPEPRSAQELAHLADVAERAKLQHRLARKTLSLRRRVIAEAECPGTAWAQGRLNASPLKEILDPMVSVAHEAAAVRAWLRLQERPRQAALVARHERWRGLRLGSPDVLPRPPGTPAPPSAPPPPPRAVRPLPGDLAGWRKGQARADERRRLYQEWRSADLDQRRAIHAAMRELDRLDHEAKFDDSG